MRRLERWQADQVHGGKPDPVRKLEPIGSQMIYSLDIDKRRDEMRRMVPKLIGERCYVVFSSELGLQCHGRLAGMTAIGLSALIAETIPQHYCGPMPAIAIVDDDLRNGRFSAEGSAMCSMRSFCTNFSHKSYGLASAERYLQALGDECQRMDWKPLAEVLATPMPEKFQKLWMHDVVRSLKSRFSKGKQSC